MEFLSRNKSSQHGLVATRRRFGVSQIPYLTWPVALLAEAEPTCESLSDIWGLRIKLLRRFVPILLPSQ